MKKLSLLFFLLTVALTALADTKASAPSRADFPEGGIYRFLQRTYQGSATLPEDLLFQDTASASFVHQRGYFEMIVPAEPGEPVFIKNIVYRSERVLGDYWVQGYQDSETGIIHVPLYQPILDRSSDGSFVKSRRNAVLVWGTVHHSTSNGWQSTFTVNTAVTEATYRVDGNNIQIENTNGPVAIDTEEDVSYDATGLGLAWEDEETADEENPEYEWMGFCEWGTTMDASQTVITERPVGQLDVYNRTSTCFFIKDNADGTRTTQFGFEPQEAKCEIVFGYDGKYVYIKDPVLAMNYGTWVIGTLTEDGQRIIVPTAQYIYEHIIDYGSGYYTYDITLMDAFCNIETSASGEDYLKMVFNDYPTELEYLIEGNTITLQHTWSDTSLDYPYNYNANGIAAKDYQKNLEVIETNVVYTLDHAAYEATKAPVINGYTVDGFNAYFVDITPTEPSTIYYRVRYPDGHYSDWETYTGTLSYTGSGDYTIEAYAVATGKLYSDLVSHNFNIPNTTGINELADGKQIAGTRYYNTMGQEISQPSGVTIVVTTYTDGTSTAVKVVK